MRQIYCIILLVFVFLIADIKNSYAQKQKIIFDCDLGSDIDDAFALALILCSPEFEVLGITLDHGLTDKRAQIACKMLYETGMEHIPVAVGRPTVEIVGKSKKPAPYRPQFRWAESFDKVKPIKTPAADFIIEMLHKYPNEIILFTVGPVPNMGDIIKKDPEVLKLAKRIYSMFGSFYVGYGRSPIPDAEWNVLCDVESSKEFAACGADIIYAGLDITTHVKLEKELRLKLLKRQSPLTNGLSALYALWDSETAVLFDVVAIGMVLWPELFSTRQAYIKVIDGGYTVIDESKSPNCKIGLSIKTDEFLKKIMERYISF
ncbi:nucleoside hydrolase [candidate division KSB1 bacterium]|nr:nucleoside hydrolase [candidate division KSB1 bacterium]